MKFVTALEAIELRMLGNGDYQQRDRMRLLKVAKHVYNDLNLSVIKTATRKKYAINKRTNTVDLDCNDILLSSVSVVFNNVEYPIYTGKAILEGADIVDISAVKDCECEHNCSHQLCHTIKGYEAVVETIQEYMPTNELVDFECITRRGVDDQGFFYEEKQYPKRIYENGVWVTTRVETEKTKKCKLELDQNGCVCDTDDNINAVCDACGIASATMCSIGGDASNPPDATKTWIYHCDSKMQWFAAQAGGVCRTENFYNLSELGDRLIFPKTFGFDHVIVRSYQDKPIADLPIPYVALDTFILGLMWWDCRFNDKKQALAEKYSADYARLKGGLIKTLNRKRISEFADMMFPHRKFPTYIIGTNSQYEGR